MIYERKFDCVPQPGGIRRTFDKPPPRQLMNRTISSGAFLKIPYAPFHLKLNET